MGPPSPGRDQTSHTRKKPSPLCFGDDGPESRKGETDPRVGADRGRTLSGTQAGPPPPAGLPRPRTTDEGNIAGERSKLRSSRDTPSATREPSPRRARTAPSPAPPRTTARLEASAVRATFEVLTRLADGDLPPPALRAKTRINLTIHTADERQTPPLYRYRQPERPEGRELRALARLPGTAAPRPECDSTAGDQRKTPK